MEEIFTTQVAAAVVASLFVGVIASGWRRFSRKPDPPPPPYQPPPARRPLSELVAEQEERRRFAKSSDLQTKRKQEAFDAAWGRVIVGSNTSTTNLRVWRFDA